MITDCVWLFSDLKLGGTGIVGRIKGEKERLVRMNVTALTTRL